MLLCSTALRPCKDLGSVFVLLDMLELKTYQ